MLRVRGPAEVAVGMPWEQMREVGETAVGLHDTKLLSANLMIELERGVLEEPKAKPETVKDVKLSAEKVNDAEFNTGLTVAMAIDVDETPHSEVKTAVNRPAEVGFVLVEVNVKDVNDSAVGEMESIPKFNAMLVDEAR